MKKKQIIIDTNFLLIPGQFMVDIFSEIDRIINEPYELCVVDKSLKELEKLTEAGKTKDKAAAKLAIILSRQKNLKTLQSSILQLSSYADDVIVKKADKNTYVATQDKALRERLRAKGAKIIGLRQKKHLVVI
jgi:rRNA-processing protein FCF1